MKASFPKFEYIECHTCSKKFYSYEEWQKVHTNNMHFTFTQYYSCPTYEGEIVWGKDSAHVEWTEIKKEKKKKL